MFLKRILKTLQILMNILVGIICVWIVFYAFEKTLPALIGEQLFYTLYHLLTTLISVCGIVVIMLVLLYAIGLAVSKKDR